MAGPVNMEVSVTGSILTLKIDLTKDSGPTKSGKALMIGTSGGWEEVPGHPTISINMNVCERISKRR